MCVLSSNYLWGNLLALFPRLSLPSPAERVDGIDMRDNHIVRLDWLDAVGRLLAMWSSSRPVVLTMWLSL
jgi:hypothetical protein